MPDNYIYTNGVLTLSTPPQPKLPAEKNSNPKQLQANAKAEKSKTRINLYLDNDTLKTLCDRAELTGKCYETLINETLRNSFSPDSGPLTIENLRQVLQEELSRLLNHSEENNRIIDSQNK